MATGDTQDIVQGLKSALPRGWFSGDTPILNALLTGLATAWSGLYAMAGYVKDQTRISTATGIWLDIIALDFFGTNLPRLKNEPDTQYRVRIISALIVEQGTRNAIYLALLRLTGRAPVIFEPARPADTGAYTAALSSFENRWLNPLLYRGNAPAAASKSLTLDTNANTAADYYANSALRIVAGMGAGQERKGITSRTNMVTYSQSIDNASYTKNQLTVTPNSAIAPDGTNTMDFLLPSVTSAEHYADENIALTAGVTYAYSCHAKAGSGSYRHMLRVAGASVAGVYTDLSTGAIVLTSGANYVGSSIQNLGGGIYRITVIFTAASSASTVIRQQVVNATNQTVFAGDGTSGIYWWGEQLEVGSAATEYIHTEANAAVGIAIDAPWSNNYILNAQDFTAASWNNTTYPLAVASNNVVAPDGSMTGDTLTDSSTVNPSLIYATTPAFAIGTQLTASIYLSQGTSAQSTFNCVDSGNTECNLTVNWSGGVPTMAAFSGPAGASYSIASDRLGWYRISISWTVSFNAACLFRIWPCNRSVATQTGSVNAWGSQLNNGPVSIPYVVTTSAAITPPDATSVYDISPNVYATAWPTNVSGASYGAVGGYGSLNMAYQALVTAYLPSTAGIPYVASYSGGGSYPNLPAGASYAAYTTPSRTEYALLANAQNNAGLNSIYQAVDAAKPAGTIVWVGTSQ